MIHLLLLIRFIVLVIATLTSCVNICSFERLLYGSPQQFFLLMFTSQALICAMVSRLIFDRMLCCSFVEIISRFCFGKGHFRAIASEITTCVHIIVISRKQHEDQIGLVDMMVGSITDLILFFLCLLLTKGRISTKSGLACVLIFTILSMNILFFCSSSLSLIFLCNLLEATLS